MDLQDKVALVTGTSRGIGYYAAKALAQSGAHVIAVARTVGGLEELDDEIQVAGGTATLVPLDLLDMEAIDRLGGYINERWGKLDILFANAGMLGGLSPIDHFEPDTFEKVYALNVTSTWRLLRSMTPNLRLSDSARVVVSCNQQSAEACKPFWGCYASSQAALISLTKTFAAENAKWAMRINLLDPGPVRTNLRAQAMPGEDKELLSHPSEISPSLLKLIDQNLQVSGKVYSHGEQAFIKD
ncbi:MAG: SDR family NAD(P)-dependent oxidoreductase [Pseudomonadota bacterium]